ncbi:putative tartrate dehydrogenase/decarboxylase [Pullulanibacillus camelliae]|uniref:D-malate dehydrogenase (decarboxylating) n=1 Tax=Pullulanibacillus camelliae TaxID=1707096 RepID=A0A8J2VLB1_9BACL|nr:tartrate dehydrogenase [Pullulanibacillus camelliae]GGE27989.1 putative tartrate dehydrogenase/decarboxylase [Pullulanibacillus camelliae]
MKQLHIASIPGDGIGNEVVPAAIEVLEAVSEIHGGLSFHFTHFPYSCDYYLEHGVMMPEDGLDQLKNFDAIFLGAVGNAKLVPDHISLWGLLIKLRREFEQVINIRPAKLLSGVPSPLVNPKDFDLIVVRENSEGEYSSVGGRMYKNEEEIAIQNSIFSRRGTERVMRYAFDLAKKRNKRVTSATKSNGIYYSMPFWDEVLKDVAKDYPEVETDSQHIDALAACFVTHPNKFDVVVASNLFGDVLTDLGAAIMGSVGIAPAANINVNGKYPSMFEPVHGSAPDITGKGIANPIGQIWTAKMMLDHFDEEEVGHVLLSVIESTTQDGILTADMGGKYTTKEVTAEIITRLKARA